ncbi:MAG: hypothetical protein IJ368_10365 [Oscillospiraceae bacterium]|nr:hypothetical protein [Oscillospiraceae bacterium]
MIYAFYITEGMIFCSVITLILIITLTCLGVISIYKTYQFERSADDAGHRSPEQNTDL